jgi:putative copper resistance protein D
MEGALALCRFAHFLAAMTLFGANLYVRAFAPADLARALAPASRRIAAIAIPLAALTALAWLSLEAASMADSWGGLVDLDDLQGVLTDTAFGAVWQGRLIVALALLVALAIGRHGSSIFMTAVSALLLASLCLVGHAAMQQGAVGALHRANHALHLLAAGAWIGGLPLFALCLRLYGDPGRRDDAARAMMRFSAWGHLNVTLIVLTGAINVALTSGAATFSSMTPYRALLVAKIAVVGMMIALALFNRYVLVPRLEPDAPARRVLMRTSLAEVALGVGVVALVSLFGLLDPF